MNDFRAVEFGPIEKPDSNAARKLSIQRASEIIPEKIDWIWQGRIARGKQVVIAGDPGLGKSQVSLAIAAAVTTGGLWPCGEGRADIGSVIILSAEDDAADTLRPRLEAAAADLDRVHIVNSVHKKHGKGRESFSLIDDLPLLEDEIIKIGDVALVIIDPISSYMGRGVDSHSNTEVRNVLEPVSEMASRLRVAILSVTHVNKSNGGKALHRFIGSVAFVATARAAFIVVEDADDPTRRLFLHAKNNLAVAARGLAFRAEQRLITGDIFASSILWEPTHVETTADEALSDASDVGGDKTSKEDCIAFLQSLLASGGLPVPEVEVEARKAGLLGDGSIGQSKPFRSARKALGIKPTRQGFGGDGVWLWSLPLPKVPSTPLDALPNEGAPMDERASMEGGAPEGRPIDRDDEIPL